MYPNFLNNTGKICVWTYFYGKENPPLLQISNKFIDIYVYIYVYWLL